VSAIVTGGGGGLGEAVAAQLLKRGVATALLDSSYENARAVATRLSEIDSARAIAVACDVSATKDVQAAWAFTESELGPIDVVVNAAGIQGQHPISTMTDDVWERVLEVNLTGAFKVCRQAATAWLDEGRSGSIVNVASSLAFVANPGGSSAYGASKSGLVGLTIQLAVELGSHGIRVNAVAPAGFRSPMYAELLKRPDQDERIKALIPMGRIGEPEEVAATIVFLALDGTYINGVTIPIDGGNIVKM
jgi:NAD(P)-dependent dehydrogenase (short-subunit alcohol dehydrogenase family)